MYVTHRFELAQYTKDLIRDMEPDFGYDGFGEFVFYRTYSRCDNGYQENWADVVIRVIQGTMTIRKDWYIKNHVSWNERFWQSYALKMAIAMFKMEWLPPGRGLWAMGTEFIYERGGMALVNCGYTWILDALEKDLAWLMDSLMLGVGVGFSPIRNDDLEFKISSQERYDFVIPDSREGWVSSCFRKIRALRKGTKQPRMIYDEIRGPGLLIRGFGGISSGPESLIELHEMIDELCVLYMEDSYYDSVMLKTDLANITGKCVVAGNVRRSAELGSGPVSDSTFKELKDYENPRFAYRASWGWMSNNSVTLSEDSDFEKLGEIAKRVIERGEPGYHNLQNFSLGRIGKRDNVRRDLGTGTNACGEMIQEGGFDKNTKKRVRETCNIDETLPTRCDNHETWLKACEYATVYTSTVSLLPTHQPSTNRVVARNRRIGVGIVDYIGWKDALGVNQTTKWMREGYKKIRQVNRWVNGEAGVPESIRVTTIKPGGTIPKLAGRKSGIGHATFNETLRRVIVAKNSSIVPLLIEAQIPYEDSVTDQYSLVFEWPIHQDGKPAEKISLWEQAMNLVLVQREWADNAVSNTLYFQPKWKLTKVLKAESDLKRYLAEEITDEDQFYKSLAKINDGVTDFEIGTHRIKCIYNQETDELIEAKVFEFNPSHEEDSIEPVLSAIAPLTKTVSLLPHTPEGVYPQMPESRLSKEEYLQRKAEIKRVDWSKLSGSMGQDERYCQGAQCELPITGV
jgi:ribonucleoside-diphosphate reductase alpha chain